MAEDAGQRSTAVYLKLSGHIESLAPASTRGEGMLSNLYSWVFSCMAFRWRSKYAWLNGHSLQPEVHQWKIRINVIISRHWTALRVLIQNIMGIQRIWFAGHERVCVWAWSLCNHTYSTIGPLFLKIGCPRRDIACRMYNRDRGITTAISYSPPSTRVASGCTGWIREAIIRTRFRLAHSLVKCESVLVRPALLDWVKKYFKSTLTPYAHFDSRWSRVLYTFDVSKQP